MSDNAAVVRRFVDEILNQEDFDGAGRFMWEDVVQQRSSRDRTRGWQAFKT